MTKIISNLPDTIDKVNAMHFKALVDLVNDLCSPSTQIQGIAGLQVNAFLSYAALRMAKGLMLDEHVSLHRVASLENIKI